MGSQPQRYVTLCTTLTLCCSSHLADKREFPPQNPWSSSRCFTNHFPKDPQASSPVGRSLLFSSVTFCKLDHDFLLFTGTVAVCRNEPRTLTITKHVIWRSHSELWRSQSAELRRKISTSSRYRLLWSLGPKWYRMRREERLQLQAALLPCTHGQDSALCYRALTDRTVHCVTVHSRTRQCIVLPCTHGQDSALCYRALTDRTVHCVTVHSRTGQFADPDGMFNIGRPVPRFRKCWCSRPD
jgi:hypothetical protein